MVTGQKRSQHAPSIPSFPLFPSAVQRHEGVQRGEEDDGPHQQTQQEQKQSNSLGESWILIAIEEKPIKIDTLW